MLMEISSFNHAALLISDIERSRHFYGEILGLQEVPRPKSFNFPGAWYRIGEQELHLIGSQEEGRVQQVNPGYRRDEMATGHGSHIAFAVPNLQEAVEHMHAHSIEIVGGPRPRGDGVQQMYVCDPDGYIVELFAWP
jgi:glyoxylase I family protein